MATMQAYHHHHHHQAFTGFIPDHSPSNTSFSEHSSTTSPSPPSFRTNLMSHHHHQSQQHHSHALPLPPPTLPPPPLPPQNHSHYHPLEHHHQSHSIMDEEDLGEDEEYLSSSASAQPGLHSHQHPHLSNSQADRLKATTAERRRNHNAVERARRTSLNERFGQLASVLPTMGNVKRPSKSVIVSKSLEWITNAQVREYHLLKENEVLRAEVNELRLKLQLECLPGTIIHGYTHGPERRLSGSDVAPSPSQQFHHHLVQQPFDQPAVLGPTDQPSPQEAVPSVLEYMASQTQQDSFGPTSPEYAQHGHAEALQQQCETEDEAKPVLPIENEPTGLVEQASCPPPSSSGSETENVALTMYPLEQVGDGGGGGVVRRAGGGCYEGSKKVVDVIFPTMDGYVGFEDGRNRVIGGEVQQGEVWTW